MDSLRQTLSEFFADPVNAAWLTFGTIGTIIFTARFYVQWYASERAKKSVVPVSFWYLSSIGAIILLLFSIYCKSPNGSLSYSLNTVIYSRNLVHIWRDKQTVSRNKRIVFQALVGLISLAAIVIVMYIWWGEIEHTKSKQQHEAIATWLWVAVGVMGQGLFASRFIIQWIATEVRRKSVMPDIFWHISLIAALLLSAAFAAQGERLLAIGPILSVPVYIRNIWLIHAKPANGVSATGSA